MVAAAALASVSSKTAIAGDSVLARKTVSTGIALRACLPLGASLSWVSILTSRAWLTLRSGRADRAIGSRNLVNNSGRSRLTGST